MLVYIKCKLKCTTHSKSSVPNNISHDEAGPNLHSIVEEGRVPDGSVAAPISPARSSNMSTNVNTSETRLNPRKLQLSKRATTSKKSSRLAESHPYRTRWPEWMSTALSILENISSHSRWVQLLELWLQFEDKLGYPYGQVS